MELALVFSGMPSGPDTLNKKSLGGSETAAICMAKELRALGHMITVFCNLDPEFTDGGLDKDGIRWSNIAQYQNFAMSTELDVIIGSRDPNIFAFPTQAKKHILWVHDLATHQLTGVLHNFAWNIDEIWTVSEFHRWQYSKIAGYPLSHIRATRNGILDVGELIQIPRSSTELLYAARPERGLINLVRPGGIMSRLLEYNLQVCFYDNWPDHLRGFYQQLFDYAKALPNVTIIGSKTQKELRQIMQRSAAYVYPTNFEEVSCIIAREAIEQKLPFIYSEAGALPETVGDCGHMVRWDKNDIGSDQFCENFSNQIRMTLNNKAYLKQLDINCSKRTDLYWKDIALEWQSHFNVPKPKSYSMCKSLIMDGDVIPAYAVAKNLGEQYWIDHIEKYYPFITGHKTMEEHYKGIYELEESKKVPERQNMRTLINNQRYNDIKNALNDPNMKSILEYGCAEGPVILQLAIDYPDKFFTGIDIAEDNVRLCKLYAEQNKLTNVEFFVGSTDNWPEYPVKKFDAAIIAEVLEHTLKPWEICDRVEKEIILGGTMIITVPSGPWEWDGLVRNPIQWPWRAHIWHVTKSMLREMFANKQTKFMGYVPHGHSTDMRAVGNITMAYFVDHQPCQVIDPLNKALQGRYRDTVSFCMIAMDDEQHILKCLKSIIPFADQIQIAIGPSIDNTKKYVQELMDKHPYVDFNIVNVPKIEARKFGFDDARNASASGAKGDWIFWIDSDEYLSGHEFKSFLRNNAFDSYAVSQHHFTCEPRGAPAQIDKPARIYRNNGKFQFFGKVHEHAEMGFNGGPGMVMMLNSIDIGHTGYVNEAVRRERFGRNFPLLEWDRIVYPERRIGKFLWFRDMFHQMQWLMERRQVNDARKVALDAVNFFKANKDEFLYIGSGPQNSLHYYSEANKLLGKGHAVKVHLEMEGLSAEYQGVFESSQEAFEIAERAVKDQIEKRNSGYWQ